MCYLTGLTRDEAAKQLGWSLGTLKRRLEEGRTAFRRRLERRGISAAGLALAVVLPTSLNAVVGPSLAESCIAAVFANEIAAGSGALVLASTVILKGVAIRTAVVCVALIGMSAAIYSGFGGAAALKPAQDKKGDEPKPEVQKADSFDDPLPPGSTMRLGTSRFRHGAGIASLAVSPDGKIAAVTNGPEWYGTTRVFDLATGRSLFTFKDGNWADAVAISPDGRSLVTKYYSTLFVHDTATGKKLREISLPYADPKILTNWLVFTPDGKAIAAATKENVIHLVDFETGKLIRNFQHKEAVYAVAISPNGKLMAAGGADREGDKYFVRLWEVDTGRGRGEILNSQGNILSLAFSPDGKTIAAGGDDGQLRLWDIEGRKELRTLPKDGPRIRSVAFSPDGKTVAAAGNSIRLYEPGIEPLRIDRKSNERVFIDRNATNLQFTDEGKSLTAAVDGAIYRWDAATGKLLTPESVGDSAVEQILVTPDGSRIITRGKQGDAHIWDAAGKHLRMFSVGGQRGMALSPDGRRMVWLDVEKRPLESAQWQQAQPPIVAGSRLYLYDLATDRLVKNSEFIGGSAKDVAFADAGKTFITVDSPAGWVRVWDSQNGSLIRRFRAIDEAELQQENYSGIRRSAVSPDGKTLVAAYYPGEAFLATVFPLAVRLWDLETGKELHVLSGHCNEVLDMAFSPDGRLLATAGTEYQDDFNQGKRNHQVFVWKVATGTRLTALPDGLPISACCIAFSPDGRSLATATPEGLIQIWETATWTVLTEFSGHRDQPTALMFTPSGQLLSGSLDTTVLAWNTRPPRSDAPATLDSAWTDLVKRDASIAFKAQGRFLSAPSETIKVFAERIKPADDMSMRIKQLIAELDSEKYSVRENASKTLGELGEQARPYLEESIKNVKSQEATDRMRKILDDPKEISLTPEQLRQIRAVQVLEWINDATSKDLLKKWAGGFKGALLTGQGKAALKRLEDAAMIKTKP